MVTVVGTSAPQSVATYGHGHPQVPPQLPMYTRSMMPMEAAPTTLPGHHSELHDKRANIDDLTSLLDDVNTEAPDLVERWCTEAYGPDGRDASEQYGDDELLSLLSSHPPPYIPPYPSRQSTHPSYHPHPPPYYSGAPPYHMPSNMHHATAIPMAIPMAVPIPSNGYVASRQPVPAKGNRHAQAEGDGASFWI